MEIRSAKRPVVLRCDCGCGMVVFEKHDWNSKFTTEYSLSFQDDRICKDGDGIFQRVRRAISVLFGKPIYYSEISTSKEEILAFLNQSVEIVQEDGV